MQMDKKFVRTLFFAIVCTASLIGLGLPLSTKVAEAEFLNKTIPPASCTRLGDNLINNQFIESAAVVGMAGTALTLLSKPESERNLASHCTPES